MLKIYSELLITTVSRKGKEMPSRADEYWASEKEDLRYCYKHKRYYRLDFGCQSCILENIEQKFPVKVTVELVECPVCGKKSLGWFDLLNQYECMSPSCKRAFSKETLSQILKSNIAQATETANSNSDLMTKERPPSKTSVEKNSDVLVCPECCESSLFWNKSKNLYECSNPDCISPFTQEQLRATYKEKLAKTKVPSDKSKKKVTESEPPKKENLVKCPICWKITVYFASEKNVYECLKCQRVYSEAEYKTLMKAHNEEPKGKGWFGNEYFDPKKKKWRKP